MARTLFRFLARRTLTGVSPPGTTASSRPAGHLRLRKGASVCTRRLCSSNEQSRTSTTQAAVPNLRSSRRETMGSRQPSKFSVRARRGTMVRPKESGVWRMSCVTFFA